MSPAAGSKRRTDIQGHTVQASPDVIRQLHRLSAQTLLELFRHAKDVGQSEVTLDDGLYIVNRLPDHTFVIDRRSEQNHSVL